MDLNVDSPSSSASPAMSYTYPAQQSAQQITPPQLYQRWSAPDSALPQLATVDQLAGAGAARKRRRSASSSTTERMDPAESGVDYPPPSKRLATRSLDSLGSVASPPYTDEYGSPCKPSLSASSSYDHMMASGDITPMSLETLRLGSPAKVGEPEAASLADRRWLVQGASDKLTSTVASSSYRSMDYDEMQSTSGGDAWDDENMDGVEGQESMSALVPPSAPFARWPAEMSEEYRSPGAALIAPTAHAPARPSPLGLGSRRSSQQQSDGGSSSMPRIGALGQSLRKDPFEPRPAWPPDPGPSRLRTPFEVAASRIHRTPSPALSGILVDDAEDSSMKSSSCRTSPGTRGPSWRTEGGRPMLMYTMGFREDCIACREKRPGHWSHLVHADTMTD